MTFASEGESYAVILSQVHKSLCLIVKQQSLQDHFPTTDSFGLTSRVLPHQVVAHSGIYVDDFLTAGPTGRGTPHESQLTFKKILLCPLILQTLSIRDGSRLDREYWEDYFGSLLALGQILPLPFLLQLKSLQRILSCSRSNSDTFAIPEHYSNFGIALPIP